MHSVRTVMEGSVHAPQAPLKSIMPRIEKMIWKTSTTAETSTMDGNVWISDMMIVFMPALRCSSRSGRSTRKMRNDLSWPKAGTRSARRPRIEISTMTKSSTFQPDLRYASGANKKPFETILSSISSTKKPVSQRLSRSRFAFVAESGSRRGRSMARHVEETTISRMVRVSKCGWQLSHWQNLRSLLSGPKRPSETPSRAGSEGTNNSFSVANSKSSAESRFLLLGKDDASREPTGEPLSGLRTGMSFSISSSGSTCNSTWRGGLGLIALASTSGTSTASATLPSAAFSPPSSSSSSSSPAKASSKMATKRFRMMKKPIMRHGRKKAAAATTPIWAATTWKASTQPPEKTPKTVSIAL